MGIQIDHQMHSLEFIQDMLSVERLSVFLVHIKGRLQICVSIAGSLRQ